MSAAPIRVAVAGAAGRMGATVCEAVDGAPDMVLTGRADPALGTTLADVLGDADVVVDFTTPATAQANALACLASGVHVVIGTTGFDPAPLVAGPVEAARAGPVRPGWARLVLDLSRPMTVEAAELRDTALEVALRRAGAGEFSARSGPPPGVWAPGADRAAPAPRGRAPAGRQTRPGSRARRP